MVGFVILTSDRKKLGNPRALDIFFLFFLLLGLNREDGDNIILRSADEFRQN
jgi:hypothetical protein